MRKRANKRRTAVEISEDVDHREDDQQPRRFEAKVEVSFVLIFVAHDLLGFSKSRAKKKIKTQKILTAPAKLGFGPVLCLL